MSLWDIARYWSKIAVLTYPTSILRPRWGWRRWNFAEIFGDRKLEDCPFIRYKNIARRFFGLVTTHAWRTDGQNYDSQDRASIAATRGKNTVRKYQLVLLSSNETRRCNAETEVSVFCNLCSCLTEKFRYNEIEISCTCFKHNLLGINGIRLCQDTAMSAPVGLERSRPSGVSSESSQPHHWRTYQSPLVAGSRTDTVQNGCSDIQGSAWRLTMLPQFVGPCRRRVWSTSTPLYRIEPFTDSAVQTVNHRRSSVFGRSSTVLEQSARHRHVSQFVVGFPAATATHTVPAVIPRHYHVTFLNCNTHSGLAVALLLRPL